MRKSGVGMFHLEMKRIKKKKKKHLSLSFHDCKIKQYILFKAKVLKYYGCYKTFSYSSIICSDEIFVNCLNIGIIMI